MLRRFLLASAGAVALSGAAMAAEPLPYVPPPVPIFSWTGLYAGIQVGYAWVHDPVTVSAITPAIAAVPPDSTAGSPGVPSFFIVDNLSDNPSGVIGGAHIGYNLQINQWVAGLEGSVDGTSVQTSRSFPLRFVSPFSLGTFDTWTDVQGSIRLRAGIAFDRVLIYATGGAAFAGINTRYTTGVPFFITEDDSKTRSGWTVGGGLVYAVTNNWSIRVEYRYSDFGHSIDYPFAVLVSPFGIFSVQHHLTQNQVQFGVSYKFDTAVPVVAKY